MVNKKVLIIFMLVILSIAIYFYFFFSYSCADKSCFQAHQADCSRAKFIQDTEDIVWSFQIKGKTDSKCEIHTESLQVKQGDLGKKILEGKSMDCLVQFGSLNPPESDLSLCHGLLKEEMQTLIIKELHTYILENVGKISEELEKKI